MECGSHAAAVLTGRGCPPGTLLLPTAPQREKNVPGAAAPMLPFQTGS